MLIQDSHLVRDAVNYPAVAPAASSWLAFYRCDLF